MPASLTFNQLLIKAGLDPKNVRLARHKPAKHHHRLLYDAAIKKAPEFQAYQESQGDPNVIAQFRKAQQVAGFVVEPGTKCTIFAGVWNVLGERSVSATGLPIKPGRAEFETELREDFDHYRGRLAIDWGLLGGERAWVQKAHKQDKHISEIRRRIEALCANVLETADPVVISVEGQLGFGHDDEHVCQEVRRCRSARGHGVRGPGGVPLGRSGESHLPRASEASVVHG